MRKFAALTIVAGILSFLGVASALPAAASTTGTSGTAATVLPLNVELFWTHIGGTSYSAAERLDNDGYPVIDCSDCGSIRLSARTHKVYIHLVPNEHIVGVGLIYKLSTGSFRYPTWNGKGQKALHRYFSVNGVRVRGTLIQVVADVYNAAMPLPGMCGTNCP